MPGSRVPRRAARNGASQDTSIRTFGKSATGGGLLVGRWNLTVSLLGGTAGTAVMIWIFVAVLQVPNGYRC